PVPPLHAGTDQLRARRAPERGERAHRDARRADLADRPAGALSPRAALSVREADLLAGSRRARRGDARSLDPLRPLPARAPGRRVDADTRTRRRSRRRAAGARAQPDRRSAAVTDALAEELRAAVRRRHDELHELAAELVRRPS